MKFDWSCSWGSNIHFALLYNSSRAVCYGLLPIYHLVGYFVVDYFVVDYFVVGSVAIQAI